MKKSLADRIEQYLKVLIDRSEDQQIEIQRSELAETFNCVPSQVTYVISTRFTEIEGYLTESRRGGKGYVRISRFQGDTGNEVRRELIDFINELLEARAITVCQGEILQRLAAHAFADMPPEYRTLLFKHLKNILADYTDAK
jgi:transcriptional regulator CtsR